MLWLIFKLVAQFLELVWDTKIWLLFWDAEEERQGSRDGGEWRCLQVPFTCCHHRNVSNLASPLGFTALFCLHVEGLETPTESVSIGATQNQGRPQWKHRWRSLSSTFSFSRTGNWVPEKLEGSFAGGYPWLCYWHAGQKLTCLTETVPLPEPCWTGLHAEFLK